MNTFNEVTTRWMEMMKVMMMKIDANASLQQDTWALLVINTEART
jgi:hypothetical protein